MQSSRYLAISRLLAFLAVVCAIAAVSWTIRDLSVVAIGIPGFAAGHLYSWRRREASIRRSLILLLFMVLTLFLGGDILLSGFGDRLLLSRYIVYGMVLGSFDLMRKGHVQGSIVLSGLLLVLVSELALDLWFLVFIVFYTIFAVISTLLSRVVVEADQTAIVGKIDWRSSIWVWTGLGTIIIVVAAVFFLLMPRVAARQVTQANWLPSRLDLRLGGPLSLPSRPGASVASGIFPSFEERERSSVGGYAILGYTGSAADSPVMNVRSQISSYWRGATFDEYDGAGWLSSSGQVRLREESRGEFILPDSKASLAGERVYWQVFYLLSEQPNAIFTGYNPGRLYLPQGTEQGFLGKGSLYRSLSAVPFTRPQLLRQDRVAGDDTANLKLPPISERTASLAESIVEGVPSDYDKAARIERFLLTNYPYKLDVEPLPEGKDAVDYFLFEQQAGYCAQFATAMAVMARQVGLPARVAGGYLPGLIDPLTGAHIVRAGDAHAWVEIHFERYGWVAFDPTPRPDSAMGFIGKRSLIRFGLEDFTGISVAGIIAPLKTGLSPGSLPASFWFWLALAAGVTPFVLLTFRFGRRWRRSGQKPATYNMLEGESRKMALNFYRRMVAVLARQGLPLRQSHQPLDEYAAIVLPQITAGQEIVERLTRLACRAAYDPSPFNPPDANELNQSLSNLKRALAKRHQK